MPRFIKYFIGVMLLTVTIGKTVGQIRFYPVHPIPGTQKVSKETARSTTITPLTLPFWDDFSRSKISPNTTKWVNSENVFISSGIGKNPPSLNVASFDGLLQNGAPYNNTDPNSTGMTDSLTSCPLDLSALSPADNVYLSFFYQFAGNGDQPEPSDSLRLEFKDNNGKWVSIWPLSAELNHSGNFTQVMQRITNPVFFHNEFQFRFQSFGRQSGPYDVWNIDYVYVNKNRNVTDTAYPDRTITTPLTRIFQNYTAVPYHHFSIGDTLHPTFTINNLYSPDNPDQPFGYTLTSEVLLIGNMGDTTKLNNTYAVTDPVESPVRINQPKAVKLTGMFDDFSNQPDVDTAVVNLTLYINAEDNKPTPEGDYNPLIYTPIDFRENDTTRTSYLLSDYYAYDDGTAELAAGGINFSGSRLAVQFDMVKDTTDHVVAVDLYFPYIGTEPAGKSIDIMVWRDLAEGPAYRETVTILRNPGLNNYVRYTFRNSIAVTNTFYVGYRQNSSGDLGIGLDRNTASGDKMYFNLNGTWEANTIVEGSLMIRPVFGEPIITTGVAPNVAESKVKVYPNPSLGIFHIHGKFAELRLFNVNGVAQHYRLSDNTLDITSLPSGLYILQVIDGTQVETIRLIKTK